MVVLRFGKCMKGKHTPNLEIGDTYVTTTGNEYLITNLTRRGKNGKNVYYSVTCNICSKDTTLFPQEFEIMKSNLLKGRLPCGCSKGYNWKKWQY